MKRTLIIAILLLAASTLWAADSLKVVKFIWDVDFEMRFDNREYEGSDLEESMTIFGARLTPQIGLQLASKAENSATHRLMFGADVMKDFGSNSTDILHEFLLYYNLSKRIGRTDMTITAGIFPKSLGAEYPDLFYSDYLKFYDSNYEGLLLTFRRAKAYYEVGCDWLGMYGAESRERFIIFSHGRSAVSPWFTIGYYAYMHHYSHSEAVRNVMDNVLINPYMTFDFTSNGAWRALDKFYVTLGWQQGAQQDRAGVGHYVFPSGWEGTIGLQKWNVGVQNRLFIGSCMMPYYSSTDALGNVYGSSLYLGEAFYRMYEPEISGYTDEGGLYCIQKTRGYYDRVELYFQPHICSFLDLRIAARFHFLDTGYAGCQQVVSLIFKLNK